MDIEQLKRELRRQRRANYIQSWIIFLLLLLFGFFSTYQLRYVKQQVNVLSDKLAQPIQGPQGNQGVAGIPGEPGVNGSDGRNGHDGSNGSNGQNVTPDQVAAAVTAYLQANPPAAGSAGKQGEPGQDGKTLAMRLNPLTCMLQSKYDTDSFWQDVAQLPLPCTGEAL